MEIELVVWQMFLSVWLILSGRKTMVLYLQHVTHVPEPWCHWLPFIYQSTDSIHYEIRFNPRLHTPLQIKFLTDNKLQPSTSTSPMFPPSTQNNWIQRVHDLKRIRLLEGLTICLTTVLVLAFQSITMDLFHKNRGPWIKYPTLWALQ